LTAVGGVVEKAGAADPPPGQRLVDRARSFALSGSSDPTRAEAEYVLCWLQAAARVSPDLADAYLWQFDLLHRLGRIDDARSALTTYCRLEPANVAARLDAVDLEFNARQTLESRQEFCRTVLERSDNAPAVVSDLHRRLAELAHRSGDNELARVHARRAVDALPQNLNAQALLLSLEGRTEDPAARVRLLLNTIAANPARGLPVWELARYLDDLSMHTEAVAWYRWALDHFRRRHPETKPPLEVLLDLASSLCDGGQHDEAFQVCNEVMAADRGLLEAQVLMIRIARLRGLREVAEKQRDMVTSQLLQSEPDVLQREDAVAAARSAWFHIEHTSDAARALRLAAFAAERLPDDPAVQRVLGWAKLNNGDAPAAEAVLAPLAEDDPHAAIGLARARLAQEKKAEAVQVLRQAESVRYSGPAYDQAVELLRELGESPASRPDRSAVRGELDAFDRAVLRFYDEPGKALTLEITPGAGVVSFGDSMRCTFTLTNIGPYPVTLGADGMVDGPQVLVSVKGTWPGAPVADAYLTVSLMRQSLLLPGEAISVREPLALGALDAFLESEPQREITLEFSFVFDPVLDARSVWTSRLPGVQAEPVRITRRPVDATPPGLKNWFAELQSGTEARRCRAAHALAALLGERHRADAGGIGYTARLIDVAAVREALFRALDDASPLVRAAATDALVLVPLDDTVIGAVAPRLSDGNFLVRMMAVDLLANAQGPVFAPVLDRLARDDADPLVRQLCRLYHAVSPTSRPVEP
jgi:tetratricopeptide (TPR) repeat protein